MEQRIRELFGMSLEIKMMAADVLVPAIAEAGQKLIDCLLNNHKILVCGQGGSAANALHFSSALLYQYEMERPALPVILLGSDAIPLTLQEKDVNKLFSRQIQALGQPGDVLLVITTSGQATSVLYAVEAAHDREMNVILLSGRDGGVLVNHLGPEDNEIRVPGESVALIRETHLFVLYALCDLIERFLFGQMMGH